MGFFNQLIYQRTSSEKHSGNQPSHQHLLRFNVRTGI